MPHIVRLKYAFVMCVTITGIAAAIVVAFKFDSLKFIFSYMFFVPIYVISYLIAPLLNKWIKYK